MRKEQGMDHRAEGDVGRYLRICGITKCGNCRAEADGRQLLETESVIWVEGVVRLGTKTKTENSGIG